MNSTQINQVKALIDQYPTLDIASLMAKQFSNEARLDEVKIGEYTAKEFLSYSNKVFNQFQEELKQTYIKALPFQYNFNNEYGNGNLNQDLNQYISHITNGNFPASVIHLNRLIHYQALNGFWEKSKRKYFRASEIAISEEKEKIDLAAKHLLNVSEDLSRFISQSQEEKDKLVNLTKTKTKELNEIESMLNSARQNKKEIENIQTQIISSLEKAKVQLENTQSQKEASKELLDRLTGNNDELAGAIKESYEKFEKTRRYLCNLKANLKNNLNSSKAKKIFLMKGYST